MKTILLIILLSLPFIGKTQQTDTVFIDNIYLDGVDIIAHDSAYMANYRRTKYFVKEIYVYAMLAAQMLNEIEDTLVLIPKEKDRNKYIRHAYRDLKKEFGYEISQLTITRGHFLMKILHKETGRTAYQIVEQYRGKLQAKSWETILRLNGTTLKKQYSPEIEDIVLDRVLKEIEEGKIKPKPRPPVTERGRKAARKRKKEQKKKLKESKRNRKRKIS